jgi:phosphoribosylglycinamide formyltransferase-1
MKKKLLIFASGTKVGGGSGFRKLCEAMEAGLLRAEIVAVVSNHKYGGVAAIAKEFGIRFIHMESTTWSAEEYQTIIADTGAEFVALSGWLKMARGLDPQTTFNIHPGLLPRFGGKGMYGRHVHEATMDAYHLGEVTHSAVTMHFVTEKYDDGPTVLQVLVEILPTDTAETLGARVNAQEHIWQWKITDMIVNGEIYWDGKNPDSVVGAIMSIAA